MKRTPPQTGTWPVPLNRAGRSPVLWGNPGPLGAGPFLGPGTPGGGVPLPACLCAPGAEHPSLPGGQQAALRLLTPGARGLSLWRTERGFPAPRVGPQGRALY